MEGYDVTMYHTQKKANIGDVRFNYKFEDINWFFINSKNRKAFTSKPGKYLPRFGGYCTYTMSKGYTYPPDPKVWHIDKKGKLYFFKDAESKRSALNDWDNVLKSAAQHWR
jgi:YHS domain-containing protein